MITSKTSSSGEMSSAPASIAGIRAVLLHAISDDAKRFYEKAGFSASPVDPMTMMIAVADVEKALVDRPR